MGNHPLLRGRSPSEAVTRIKSFTGQSLSVPEGATALLKLSTTAAEAPSPDDLEAANEAVLNPAAPTGPLSAHSRAVTGRAQGLVMAFGKGRVVMLGEAAMLSAQIIKFTEGDHPTEMKVGMNVPGNDDRQFALNVLHWLSGLLK